MAKYSSTIGFANEPELGNKGLVITVKKNGDILGHLMAGKASLVWFKKSKKTKGHQVDWETFANWITTVKESDASRP